MKTTGNTIFISGGSAGIGLEIAKIFSQNGNKVIINGRDTKRLENALSQLVNAEAIQGDLSIEKDRIRIANELVIHYPNVNMIINNAGLAYAYQLNTKANAYEKAMNEINTNYLSIIHFTELLLPKLLEKEGAAIVNISSIVAFYGHNSLPTYSASKAALHNYTQTLRNTLKGNENLHIYEVYPPLVNTQFSKDIGGENGIPPEEVAQELFDAFRNNQTEVPVGQTKKVHLLVEEAFKKLEQN